MTLVIKSLLYCTGCVTRPRLGGLKNADRPLQISLSIQKFPFLASDTSSLISPHMPVPLPYASPTQSHTSSSHLLISSHSPSPLLFPPFPTLLSLPFPVVLLLNSFRHLLPSPTYLPPSNAITIPYSHFHLLLCLLPIFLQLQISCSFPYTSECVYNHVLLHTSSPTH